MRQVYCTIRDFVSKNKFIRNWSYLVVSNILGQLFGMLATIRIARLLEPAGYGEYNVILTVASIGTVVVGFGLRNVVTRECARHPERSGSVFAVSGILQSALLIIVATGIFVYGYLSPEGLTISLSAIAIGVLVGQAGWELVESVAFGHERMEFSAGLNLLGSILWVAAVWLAPPSMVNLFWVSFSFAALQSLKVAGYYLSMRRNRLLPPLHSSAKLLAETRSLVEQSLPFYWLALLTAVTGQLPILFLVERSGQVEVGLYNIGFRLVNPLQMLVYTALLALYPGLSKSSISDDDRFMKTIRRSLLGITLLGTLGAVAISLLRREIVVLLFGEAYVHSADAMAFQVWFSVLYAIFCLIGTVLAAADRQKWLAGLSTAYALIATPIIWWGSAHGATGLAMGVLGGAILNMAYHWIIFEKSLPQSLTLSFKTGLLSILGIGTAAAVFVPDDMEVTARMLIVLTTALSALVWLGREMKQRNP